MRRTIQRRLSGLMRPRSRARGVALCCLRAGHVRRSCAHGGRPIVETARGVRGCGHRQTSAASEPSPGTVRLASGQQKPAAKPAKPATHRRPASRRQSRKPVRRHAETQVAANRGRTAAGAAEGCVAAGRRGAGRRPETVAGRQRQRPDHADRARQAAEPGARADWPRRSSSTSWRRMISTR